MSDTTTERPGEVGLDLPDSVGHWIRQGEWYWIYGRSIAKEPLYAQQLDQSGFPGTDYCTEVKELPRGGWSRCCPSCLNWSVRLARQADELTEVKWERDKFKRIDECNQGTIELAIRRAEAAEQRVKEIQAAWNRVAGFAVSESCGPENRFRITIDYPTLEKLQDAYRAMHDITTAIATTPPADGAQSS